MTLESFAEYLDNRANKLIESRKKELAGNHLENIGKDMEDVTIASRIFTEYLDTINK